MTRCPPQTLIATAALCLACALLMIPWLAVSEIDQWAADFEAMWL